MDDNNTIETPPTNSPTTTNGNAPAPVNDARTLINANREQPTSSRIQKSPPNFERPAGRSRTKQEWSTIWKETKNEAKSQRNRAEMLSKKCDAIENSKDQLKLELEEARRNLTNEREDHAAAIGEVERDRRRYRQERDNFRSDNRNLSDRNNELLDRVDELSSDRVNKQAHIANLNERNLDLAKELSELKEKYHRLRTKQSNDHYHKYKFYEDKNSMSKSSSRNSFRR